MAGQYLTSVLLQFAEEAATIPRHRSVRMEPRTSGSRQSGEKLLGRTIVNHGPRSPPGGRPRARANPGLDNPEGASVLTADQAWEPPATDLSGCRLVDQPDSHDLNSRREVPPGNLNRLVRAQTRLQFGRLVTHTGAEDESESHEGDADPRAG
jgi:hypothetical protein